MRKHFIIYCLIIVSPLSHSQALNQFDYSWQKMSDSTAFSPRDSSPNACVVFNEKIWILAGWRYEGNEWISKSDVWCSQNGTQWNLINNDPPYSPYSQFLVFRNKIWALGDAAFSTTDGTHWIREVDSIPCRTAGRALVVNGNIICVSDSSIYKSNDGKKWKLVLENAPWGTRYWFGLQSLNRRIYYFGGGLGAYQIPENEIYYNDVWIYKNGKKWKMIKGHAEWEGRYWFTSSTFDDKLWIFGGWKVLDNGNDQFGNLNDVWSSSDGRVWKRENDAPWQNRHAAYAWNFNNALYFSSGYGGGGTKRLYNDVWKFEVIK